MGRADLFFDLAYWRIGTAQEVIVWVDIEKIKNNLYREIETCFASE